MKKIIIFLIALFCSIFQLVAQNDTCKKSNFYYYKGEKIYITINPNNVVVYSTNVKKDIFNKSLSNFKIVKEINVITERPTEQVFAYQLSFDNYNYDSVFNILKNNPLVSDVEPTIGTQHIVNVSNIFYVKLKKESDYEILDSNAKTNGVKILRKVPYSNRWYALEVDKNSKGNTLEISKLFWETKLFDDVDPGFIFNFQPNYYSVHDSLFNFQWGMNSINACNAWEITTGINSIKVAIIDQGVDINHREFTNTNVSYSFDATNNNYSQAYVYGYHGTHVGGIIFASHNANNIVGVAPNVSLMNISHSLFGSNTLGEELAVAINQAVINNAFIINNSWGDQGGAFYNDLHSSLLESALDNAIDNGRNGMGCVIVFAAGNHSPAMDYPATYRNDILTVGSIDSNRIKANSSGFGSQLDVVAPGVSIYSTIPNNSYIYDKGTSMAAPHVSGVAALTLSVNPDLTGQQVRDIIESTAQKVGNYSYQSNVNHPNGTWNNEMGYGLVDAYAAVIEACFYGHLISGDTNVSTCQISSFNYEGNLLDKFKIYWKVSPNCAIYSGQNSTHVGVVPLYGDTATLYACILLNNDTLKIFSKKLSITDYNTNIVTPNLSNGVPIDSVWNTEYTLIAPVIIPTGKTLTVNANISCMPHVKIIVEHGGRLIINHAEISSYCENFLWRGIEVWGSPNEGQYAVNRSVTSSLQGEVVLNNAVIKNAVCGVRVGKYNLRNQGKGGGVIKAANTQFINNQKAVHFNAYSHVNAFNRVADNISCFNNCVFTVDDNAYFVADTGNVQVALYNVRGVQFNGCQFEDMQTKTDWQNFGTAIYACRAGFRMNELTDMLQYPATYYSTPCTFNNYKNAIAIAGSAEKPIKIYNTMFSNNSIGVNAKNADALSILSCYFSGGNESFHSDVHGLILDSCNLYRIENNQFFGIGNGIKIIGKTADNNTIRLNTFNSLCKAIEVYENNGNVNYDNLSGALTGLQFECNEFITDSTDIYVANQAIVKCYQGWNGKACGNYFGDQSIMHFNNLNTQNPLFYFYDNNITSQMPSRHHYLFITGTTPDICGERHGYIGDSYYDMQATVPYCEDRYNDHIELYLAALDNYNTTYEGISIDWNNITAIDETSNPQLFDLVQLSELKNSLDETCIEAIHLLGNATEVEITEITTWLQRLSSLNANLLSIHYLAQGNDVSQLQLAWNQITQHYSDVSPHDTSYYQYCINQLNAWARDTSIDVNISQGAIDTIIAIANSNNTASPFAVSVLECINEHYPWWQLRIHTGCSWTLPIESMSPKKETEQGQTDAIQLRPNPTNGMIEIKSNNVNIKQIELYDIFGKLLMEKNANETTVTLDMYPYAKGMYLLRYTLCDDTQKTKKIIKE